MMKFHQRLEAISNCPDKLIITVVNHLAIIHASSCNEYSVHHDCIYSTRLQMKFENIQIPLQGSVYKSNTLLKTEPLCNYKHKACLACSYAYNLLQ